jgi:hypothetical protein
VLVFQRAAITRILICCYFRVLVFMLVYYAVVDDRSAVNTAEATVPHDGLCVFQSFF